MPLFLIVIGLVFVIASVKGTHKEFFETVRSDFTGPGNFIYWGLSIWVIVAIGYIKALKPLSDTFLVLIVLMLLLANRGFFARFMDILSGTEQSSGMAISPSQAVSVVTNQILTSVGMKGF